MLFMSSFLSVFATTYYVDQSGSDNNNGLTTGTPWKTVDKVAGYSLSPGFAAGDQILFKRGNVFSGNLYFRSSGSSGNPIVIGAYGSGDKPCISNMQSLPGLDVAGNWTDLGNNIWRMSMASDPWRVWLDNVEYVEANTNAPDPLALINSQYRWYYNSAGHYLYLWSAGNPAGYYSSSSGLHAFQHEVQFSGASYVTMQDLDLAGGYNGALLIMNGSHDITMQNCKIRKCHHGVYVQGIDALWNSRPCYNIYIRNNEIDSQAAYSYNYEYYNIGEGVNFRSGVTDSEVSGNTFRDWGHSCINLYADLGEGIKRCRIFNNQCYGENISYCRGLGFNQAADDSLTDDNEMYGNTIKNTTVPNQINCSNFNFHDNIIDTVTHSPARVSSNGGQGLCMYIIDANPSAKNNIIRNNVITNCDDVGICLLNGASSSEMTNNLIENNTVSNCGLNVHSNRVSFAGATIDVTETVSGSIMGNSFLNNKLTGSAICDVYYKGSPLSIYAFNQMNGNDYNVIADNFSNVARGKTYTLSNAPNYALCTDSPGDTIQLTDGAYYTGTAVLWVQMPYTVGWSWRSPAITIDLGQVRQIKGASFNTAAGTAGVYWPSAISIAVSNDGVNYTAIGDLVSLSNAENGAPPAYGTYNVHCYKTQGLNTSGRYVRLTVTATGQFVFSDEIEIFEK